MRTRRAAQTIYYTLDGADARSVLETLHGLYCRDGASAARRPTPAAASGPQA